MWPVWQKGGTGGTAKIVVCPLRPGACFSSVARLARPNILNGMRLFNARHIFNQINQFSLPGLEGNIQRSSAERILHI